MPTHSITYVRMTPSAMPDEAWLNVWVPLWAATAPANVAAA